MQGRTHLQPGQLFERAGCHPLVLGSHSCDSDCEAAGGVDFLASALLGFEHLGGALRDGHEAWRFKDLAAPREVLEGLFFHFDVEEEERVETDLSVFFDAVVEGRRFPGVGEEHHADCLSEVVEL